MLPCSAFSVGNELIGSDVSSPGERHFVGHDRQAGQPKVNQAGVDKPVFDQALDGYKHSLLPMGIRKNPVFGLRKKPSWLRFLHRDKNFFLKRVPSFHMSDLRYFGSSGIKTISRMRLTPI